MMMLQMTPLTVCCMAFSSRKYISRIASGSADSITNTELTLGIVAKSIEVIYH